MCFGEKTLQRSFAAEQFFQTPKHYVFRLTNWNQFVNFALPKKTSFACFQGKKKLCFFKPFALQSNGSNASNGSNGKKICFFLFVLFKQRKKN